MCVCLNAPPNSGRYPSHSQQSQCLADLRATRRRRRGWRCRAEEMKSGRRPWGPGQPSAMVQCRPQKWARVQEQQHSVSTLGTPGCPADFEGPFRSNIRSFLLDFARGPGPMAPALSLPGVRAWTLPLRCETGTPLSLHILEENPSLSLALHCDRCRVLGWAHHPVCAKRYHFIICRGELEESTGVGKGRKLCLGCSRVNPAFTKKCPGCGSDATKSKGLEARTHLLHGVIHANGYGHLLRVNGREGGSHTLSGREIMDLWDRLCTMLRARKVSVMDVSKKYNLEFRLLHAIAYGHCWYGRWGYSFGRGSFNISSVQYADTLLRISRAQLQKFANVADKEFSRIVGLYRHLSKPSVISTVGELVCAMMELLEKLRREAFPSTTSLETEGSANSSLWEEVTISNSCGSLTSADFGSTHSRWPVKRLEQAQEALLNILRASEEATWLSRQILRESARSHIGDTGLLDFVLKGFVDKTIDGEIVRRRSNERTRMLEYRLEAVDVSSDDDEDGGVTVEDGPQYNEVVEDLVFVYDAVLETMPDDSQTLLDVKQLIKDYMGEFTRDQYEFKFTTTRGHDHEHGDEPFRVLCYLGAEEEDDENTPPPELVVLPRSATIGDLKQSAEKAYRDVYLSFDKFQVVSISELDGAEDSQKLSTMVEFRQPVCLVDIQGTGIDESSPARHEAGTEDWIVNCLCGTKDDDGERMVECGSCTIWYHTRCAGIHDSDPVPQRFVCVRCCRSDSSIGSN